MDTNKIIEYIMTTPHNTNWAVLSSMLDDGDWEEFRKYVMNTSGNMNRRVLESFVGKAVSSLITVLEGEYNFTTTTEIPGAFLTVIEEDEILFNNDFIFLSLDGEDFIKIYRLYDEEDENVMIYTTSKNYPQDLFESITLAIKNNNIAIFLPSTAGEGEHSIIIQLDSTEESDEEPIEEPTFQMLGQLDLLFGTKDTSTPPSEIYTISIPAAEQINSELTEAFWPNGNGNTETQSHAYGWNGSLNISKNSESGVLTIEYYYNKTDNVNIETAVIKWYSVIVDGNETGKVWEFLVNGEHPAEQGPMNEA